MNDKTTTLGGILSDQAANEAQKTAKYRAVALDRLSKQGVTDPNQIDEFVNFMKSAEKSNFAKSPSISNSAEKAITDRLMRQAATEGSDVAWSSIPMGSIAENAVEAPQRFGLLRKGLGLAGKALTSPTSMGVMELTRSDDLGPTEGIGAALESGQKLSPEQMAQLKTENTESQEDLREQESRRKRFDNLRKMYGRDIASFDVNDIDNPQRDYGKAVRDITMKKRRLGE